MIKQNDDVDNRERRGLMDRFTIALLKAIAQKLIPGSK